MFINLNNINGKTITVNSRYLIAVKEKGYDSVAKEYCVIYGVSEGEAREYIGPEIVYITRATYLKLLSVLPKLINLDEIEDLA